MPADRSLSPADASVALRSFPRRFREVFARPNDHDGPFDPDEIGRRVPPDGTSAADHLVAADGILALLDGALELVRGGADPVVVHPAFADLTGASWDDEHTPVPALLDQFEATALRTADRVESVASSRWGAGVRIADHETASEVLDVTQDAVAAVSGHLRSAQKAMDAVRP